MGFAVWTELFMNPSFLPGKPWPVAPLDRSAVRDYLLTLLCQLAYQEGDFVLSSGQRSSYYINCKPVTLHPYGALATGRLLLPLLATGTQGVAGLTLGADPIVASVAVVSAYEQQPVIALIVRKETKGHGTQAYIEGPVVAGARIAVLEDVVTTGQSALIAVQRLRDAGYQVNQIISLVDRQQGGAELYAQENLDFTSIFQISDLQAKYQQLKNEQ
jgi:orotate phosphoribosyltransferase